MKWFWADASGDNGEGAQALALRLIERLSKSEHQVVVIEGSGFDRKAWALCKSNNAIAIEIVRTYMGSVRQNSDRCRIFGDNDVALLRDPLVSQVKPDDHYLVRAQRAEPDSIVVTTDAPLIKILEEHSIPCLRREVFLKQYFQLE
jgi:hypothetical protein